MKPNNPPPVSENRTRALLAVVAAASLLSGCLQTSGLLGTKPVATTKVEPAVAEKPAEPPQPDPLAIPEPQEKPKPGKLYEWNGNGRSVSRVVVSIDEQRARFYDDEEQIGWSTIASGVSKHPTPVGHFDVLEKVEKKKSNLYGRIYNKGGKLAKSNAKMGQDKVPPGGRFDGAKMPYFMRLTYDGIGLHAGPIPRPGKPASHGCIRMPKQLAPILYKHVTTGTPVTIHGKGPDYGNYAERQRIARAKQQLARELRAEEEAAASAAAATAVTGAAHATMPSREEKPATARPSSIINAGTDTESQPNPPPVSVSAEPEANPVEVEPSLIKTEPQPSAVGEPKTSPENSAA